jgi:hypothetical protein
MRACVIVTQLLREWKALEPRIPQRVLQRRTSDSSASSRVRIWSSDTVNTGMLDYSYNAQGERVAERSVRRSRPTAKTSKHSSVCSKLYTPEPLAIPI